LFHLFFLKHGCLFAELPNRRGSNSQTNEILGTSGHVLTNATHVSRDHSVGSFDGMCDENREDSDIPDNEGKLEENKLNLHAILFRLIVGYKTSCVNLLSLFYHDRISLVINVLWISSVLTYNGLKNNH
jgi:hypothetical protein